MTEKEIHDQSIHYAKKNPMRFRHNLVALQTSFFDGAMWSRKETIDEAWKAIESLFGDHNHAKEHFMEIMNYHLPPEIPHFEHPHDDCDPHHDHDFFPGGSPCGDDCHHHHHDSYDEWYHRHDHDCGDPHFNDADATHYPMF